MQKKLSRRMFSLFGFFAILSILFSTPTEVKAESTLSKVYTTYIIEPGVFAIETLNEMFATLTGGSINLLANTSSSTSSGSFFDDYVIDPLGTLFYNVFDFSVDVPQPITTTTTPKPTTTTTTLPPVQTPPTESTTTPSVVNYYTTESSGEQGARGPQGPQGPRGERGPAGADAVVDTSKFVSTVFLNKQVDGILGSIENGIEGLSQSLGEEVSTDLVTTGLLNVSGAVTIGSALSGTDKALVVNNNTSTGNIAEFQDGGTAVVTIADGGDLRISNAIAQTGSQGLGTNNLVTSISSSGKKERFAGNGGLGQSRPTYYDISQSDSVSGTRDSSTQFTRSSGTWTTSALVSQFAFFSTAAAPQTGSWLPITANTTTTITVTGTIPVSADTVRTSPWNPIANTYTQGQGGFNRGMFDGESIWLSPWASGNMVKVNPATGAMTNYPTGLSYTAASAFDGKNIWLPSYAGAEVLGKFNPSTGSITTYAHSYGGYAFSGSIFDGKNIWLIPDHAAYLVKVDPATGEMTNYSHGQPRTYEIFSSAVFDGESIWLIPGRSQNLVKVNPATGDITNYPHGQGDWAFNGAVFDGESIWLVPRVSANLVKVNPATGAMTSFAHNQAGSGVYNPHFTGGVFDGEAVWLIPYGSYNLVRVNPVNGEMTTFAHGQGATAFSGGVFDGESIWLIPAATANIVRVRPPSFGRESLFTPGALNVGGGSSILGSLTISQTVTDTGALKGIVYTGAVNTNQTLSTEIPSLTLTTAGRQWATGALTTQREVLITQPTYSFVGASTITNAATVGIAGAPIASTNATLTNSHALLIQAGAVTGGVVTNSYGLTVNAQTGATNNYAAQFLGGSTNFGSTTTAGTSTTIISPSVTGGSATSNFLNITGTQPTTLTAAFNGTNTSITTAGSSAQFIIGNLTTLNAGYTGSSLVAAGRFTNNVAGTGTQFITTGGGNFGLVGYANSSTSGTNIGLMGQVQAYSTGKSFGVVGINMSQTATGAQYGGLFGTDTEGTATIEVGLAAILTTNQFNSESFVGQTAALLADNMTVAAPIFIARDAGSAVFTIADGGAVSVGSATPLITTDTTDGSDSKYLEINGGGATGNTRGGRIQISGNERATTGGSLEFITGNVTTGDLIFYTGSDTERARISNASSSAATLRLYTKDDSVGPAISLRQSNEVTSGFDIDQDSLVNGDLSLYRVTTGTRTHVLSVQRSNGNMGLGVVSPGALLDISNTGTTGFELSFSGVGNANIYQSAANQPLYVTTNGGGLCLGTTTNGCTFSINTSGNPIVSGVLQSSTTSALVYSATNGTTHTVQQIINNTTNATGANSFIQFYTGGASANNKFGVVQNASGGNDFVFSAYSGGFVERMRVTSGGNVGIGETSPSDLLHLTTGNLRIGSSTAVRSGTAGTNQLIMFDGTAPVGTLANGVSLYSDTGELRVMDAAGNNTLLSPHEDENNYWVFDSTNSETGKSLIIDMEEMMKRLNNTFGWDFVHETIDGVDLDAEPTLELPDTFFGAITDRIVAWFADASNGIGNLFADKVYTKELCVTKSNGEDFCVTGDQLENLVGAGEGSSGGSGGGEEPQPEADQPLDEDPGGEEIIPAPEEVPTDSGSEIVPEEIPAPESTPEETVPESTPETI